MTLKANRSIWLALAFLAIAGGAQAPMAHGEEPGNKLFAEAAVHLTNRDYVEAAVALNKAANAGHVAAMERYAWLLWHGLGEPRDRRTGFTWYRKAARLGNTAAMLEVGKALKFGNNVPLDLNEARYWFEKAAEKGSVEAMFRLGILYQYGEGVAKDADKARGWFEKAAERGHTGAAVKLGLMARPVN